MQPHPSGVILDPSHVIRADLTESADAVILYATRASDGTLVDRANLPWRLVQAFPERHQRRKRQAWQIPLTDHVADTLSTHDYVCCSPLVDRVLKYWRLVHAQQHLTARRNAEFAATGKTPDIIDVGGVCVPMGHQYIGAIAAIQNDGYALFYEQGTGKTLCAIIKICEESKRVEGRMYRALIVCPKAVRLNWQLEFARFAHVRGRVTVIRGDKIARTKRVLDAFVPESGVNYTVLVIGYDLLWRMWEQIRGIEWDAAILDESQYIKSPEAERSKACLQLRDRAKSRLILTGTPVANKAHDLWTQLEFLGKGRSGFSSFSAFQRYFENPQFNGAQGFALYDRLRNMRELKGRLARQSFTVHKAEVLRDLPPIVYDTVEVEMSAKQAKHYADVRDHLTTEIQESLDSAENPRLVANNALVKLLRLSQITSGFLVVGGELDENGEEISPRETYLLDNPKADAVVAKLRERGPNSKTLIWCCWRTAIDALSKALNDAGIYHALYHGGVTDKQRELAVEAFNSNPACTVLLGNQESGGIGLNLLGYSGEQTTNCDSVYHIAQRWSSTVRQQSDARAHRRGTRVQVQVTDFCVPQSIDCIVRDRVLEKIDLAKSVLDVSSILEELRAG